MSDAEGEAGEDRRWPRSVYRHGSEPDARFSFANERTFLAWIRTGLGFLAAGLAIAAVARLGSSFTLEVRVAAVILVTCGLLCGITALTRWMRSERAIRLNQPLPSSRVMPLLTVGLVLVALVSFVAVTLT